MCIGRGRESIKDRAHANVSSLYCSSPQIAWARNTEVLNYLILNDTIFNANPPPSPGGCFHMVPAGPYGTFLKKVVYFTTSQISRLFWSPWLGIVNSAADLTK